jgi:hypothetical protein
MKEMKTKERVYLDDIPREIQDLIFEGDSKESRIAFKEWSDAPESFLYTEYLKVVNRLREKNPNTEISLIDKKQSLPTGCLFSILAVILFGVVVNIPDEMWKTNPGFPVILCVLMVVFVLIASISAGVSKKDICQIIIPDTPPKPKPAPEIMPKQSLLTACKTCGKKISQTAPACPHCGEHFPGIKVFCPKCKSSNIQIGNKGYGALKAAAGALILGPGGLLVGFHGRKDIQLNCLSCGHKWKPKGKLG